MGLYFCKSIRVGLFRFNLSGSGIGVSCGIPGLRIGTGPRGHYISAGRGGIYYRTTLPQTSSVPSTSQATAPKPSPVNAPHVYDPTLGHFQNVDAGAAAQMQDISSQGLLDDLNERHRRMPLSPWCVGLLIIATLGLCFLETRQWLFVAVTLSLVFITIAAAFRDSHRRTAVLLYDLDTEMLQAFANLHSAFDRASASQYIWHIASRAAVLDRKYHSGASSVIDTEKVTLQTTAPPKVKTNIRPLTVPLGSKTLYFFPDRLLILDATGFGAIAYQHLRLDLEHSQFIMGETTAPSDAQILGYTWRYVNKSGGPDRRFNNNPQIPVIATARLHLSTDSGLNGILMFSAINAPASFTSELRQLVSILTAPPPKEAASALTPGHTPREQRLYCLIHEEVSGPYTSADINRLLAQGAIGMTTLACPEGQETWQPLTALL